MQALSVFSLSLPASSRVLLCPSLYPYPLERDGYGQRCQSFCIPLSVCLHRSVYLYLSGPVSFIWLVSTMRFRELFASSSIPESIFSFSSLSSSSGGESDGVWVAYSRVTPAERCLASDERSTEGETEVFVFDSEQ